MLSFAHLGRQRRTPRVLGGWPLGARRDHLVGEFRVSRQPIGVHSDLGIYGLDRIYYRNYTVALVMPRMKHRTKDTTCHGIEYVKSTAIHSWDGQISSHFTHVKSKITFGYLFLFHGRFNNFNAISVASYHFFCNIAFYTVFKNNILAHVPHYKNM